MKPLAPLSIVASVLVCGCVATAPEWEARFGDAARQARASQTADPAASTRNVAQPVVDGKATAGAQTKYAASFDYAVKEAKQPALTIVDK